MAGVILRLNYAEAAAKLLKIDSQVQVFDPKRLELGLKEDVVDWLKFRREATAGDIWKLAEDVEERVAK